MAFVSGAVFALLDYRTQASSTVSCSFLIYTIITSAKGPLEWYILPGTVACVQHFLSFALRVSVWREGGPIAGCVMEESDLEAGAQTNGWKSAEGTDKVDASVCELIQQSDAKWQKRFDALIELSGRKRDKPPLAPSQIQGQPWPQRNNGQRTLPTQVHRIIYLMLIAAIITSMCW